MSRIYEKFPQLSRKQPQVLQLNVGKKCNQICTHCHVSAGPDRKEDMDQQTAESIISLAERYKFTVADITGGAPEINAQFPYLLEELTRLTDKVIVRCNLTAAMSRKKILVELFQEYRPVIVASLPCYLEDNVDQQRGEGVFHKSIEALQWLNKMGYGKDYELTLVYNPQKPVLPPDSLELEVAYKRELEERYGIVFNNLIAIANVPIGRYGEELQAAGLYKNYIELLKDHFNEKTLEGLMCLDQLNVDWQGRIFDCDFNNQIELHPMHKAYHVDEFSLDEWMNAPVAVAEHCFTCTAGCGSSCGGALAGEDIA
ncbi:MAG: arsenosugar biosynthesis radical SAM protein ArsS [Lentisphaerales bacterium]|nr:arsenosugar biosynthesis radical SAM protein ArsS [Lentisphaerales bacterium]